MSNLRNIAPVLRELADAGPALTRGLDFLSTYPWVKSTIANWFRGDFANITLVIDLTLSRIDSSLFTGTRWEGDLTELELQWGRTIGQMPSPYTAGNPLDRPVSLGGLLTAALVPHGVDSAGDPGGRHAHRLQCHGVRLRQSARVARYRTLQRDARAPRVRRAVPVLRGDLPRHRDRQGQLDRRHPRRRSGRSDAQLGDEDPVPMSRRRCTAARPSANSSSS